jgi:hypothetical protein
MLALVWNWYEIVEASVVSLVFFTPTLGALLWRIEKHRRQSARQHVETMAAHRRTHEHLGIEP